MESCRSQRANTTARTPTRRTFLQSQDSVPDARSVRNSGVPAVGDASSWWFDGDLPGFLFRNLSGACKRVYDCSVICLCGFVGGYLRFSVDRVRAYSGSYGIYLAA